MYISSNQIKTCVDYANSWAFTYIELIFILPDAKALPKDISMADTSGISFHIVLHCSSLFFLSRTTHPHAHTPHTRAHSQALARTHIYTHAHTNTCSWFLAIFSCFAVGWYGFAAWPRFLQDESDYPKSAVFFVCEAVIYIVGRKTHKHNFRSE